jgi:hypothetical protein
MEESAVTFGAAALGVVRAAEFCDLRPANVPRLLEHRGNLRVGNEAPPAVQIPVEERLDAVGLSGIPEDRHALGAVLPRFSAPLVEKIARNRS